MRRVTAPASADLWHHYGRTRHATDRTVPDTFRWAWGQDRGPGPDVLGALSGLCVADLGAGAARHAAHLAVHHRPARVVAVDASPAQHAMATDLYGRLAPRLRLVRSDVVEHLRAAPGTYDVLYSVFGAVDFTDPRHLLPVAASALRRGGRLVFSTLAHYLGGAPAQADAEHADIPARTPDGEPATMRRWVLREHAWTKLLYEAGFTRISVDLPPAGQGPRAADTLLLTAWRGAR
ncbi:class I SAM-dependent methyltransferase [Streptomyces sp. NPDC018955]|uniref:class I SAM-dependent methyltransferase n=1 Tax=Streptomyces sp. NPDC018955 TaxID=3365055 RepID=UPI0037B24984